MISRLEIWGNVATAIPVHAMLILLDLIQSSFAALLLETQIFCGAKKRSMS